MKYSKLATTVMIFLLMGGNTVFAADYLMDPVFVTAEKDKALGELVYETQSIGLLGKKDILDTPFSSVRISEKSFSYFASPSAGIVDVLSLTPSVRSSSGSLYNDVSIRGFNLSGHGMYINGIPGLLDQQHLTDVFVDSVSVISGPNLGIAGTPITQAVAGTVDFHSKVAQSEPNADLTLAYRGGSSFSETVDVGRRFGPDERYGIRVMANNIEGETSIENERLTQRNLFVNLDQKTEHSRTNLLLGYNYTDHQAGRFTFSFGSNVTSLPSAPDASKNYKPDWSYNEYDNWIAALNHEQKLSAHTSAFLNAGYHREDWYGYIDGSPGIINNNGDYSISLTNYPLALTKKYLGLGIKGDVVSGKIRHDYVVSMDKNWYNYWLGQSPDFGTYTVTGNLYENNWWPSPTITHYKPEKSQDMQMFGWHILDTISTDNDRLQVLLGIHGHRATQTKAGADKQKYDSTSPTYAVNYRLKPNLSVYASHTENFAIGTTVPTNQNYANAGQLLDPNKTKQNEVGVKFKSGNLISTLSLFRIEQNNYNDFTASDGTKYYKEYGKQKNKGVEWMISGSINDKLDLMGGIMYLDAEQALSGKQVNGAAKWSSTLGAVYKATDTLSLIARANYQGTAPINNEALKVPSHFTFDLGASYKVKMNNTPATLQLMCYNLTNKDYWLARASSSSVLLGAPRTIVMSAAFQL